MKKLTTAIIICLTMSQSVWGVEMWITTAEPTSIEKLQSLVDKKQPEYREFALISSFDAQLRHPLEPSRIKSLMELETAALAEYYKGDFRSALESYQNLVTQLYEVPNVSGIQKIMISAQIRRAEITELLKKPDAEKFWRDAAIWSSNAVLSKEEFSPPVIQKLSKANDELHFEEVTFLTEPNSALVLDGKRIEAAENLRSLKLARGNHQANILIPGGSWTVKKIEVTSQTRHKTFNFKWRPIVTGTCEKPQLTNILPNHIKLLVYFDAENCERVYDGHNWFTQEGRRMDLMPTSVVNRSEAGLVMSVLNPPKNESWLTRAARSPWFWTAVGVVAAGTVYLVKQSQEVEQVPTHTMK